MKFGTKEDVRTQRLEEALERVDKLQSRASRGKYIEPATFRRARQKIKDLVKDLHDTVRRGAPDSLVLPSACFS